MKVGQASLPVMRRSFYFRVKETKMGTFRENIKIANSEDLSKSIEIEAVVDSGAAYTWVPAGILEQLGISRKLKRKLKIADGSIIERDAGIAYVSLRDGVLPTVVIFGDEGSEPLLGAITLEEFALAIDPVNKVLVPIPALLL